MVFVNAVVAKIKMSKTIIKQKSTTLIIRNGLLDPTQLAIFDHKQDGSVAVMILDNRTKAI